MSGSNLTLVQVRAARMIASGLSLSEIADRVQVNRSTLYRWRGSIEFAETVDHLVSEAKRVSEETMVKDIEEIKGVILHTLVDVANNDSSGGARVAAAKVLNDMVIRAEERADPSDVMKDQSDEIKGFLKLIHEQNSQQVPG